MSPANPPLASNVATAFSTTGFLIVSCGTAETAFADTVDLWGAVSPTAEDMMIADIEMIIFFYSYSSHRSFR